MLAIISAASILAASGVVPAQFQENDQWMALANQVRGLSTFPMQFGPDSGRVGVCEVKFGSGESIRTDCIVFAVGEDSVGGIVTVFRHPNVVIAARGVKTSATGLVATDVLIGDSSMPVKGNCVISPSAGSRCDFSQVDATGKVTDTMSLIARW